MTKSVTITARIAPALAKKLAAYAKATGRTRSWVIESVLERNIDDEIAVAKAAAVPPKSTAAAYIYAPGAPGNNPRVEQVCEYADGV